MRFQSALFAFATSLALVNAQDLSGIPNCALPCFVAALPGSGCGLTDTKCQCTTGRTSITNSISACAPTKCGASDVASLAPAVQSLCAKAGVTISDLPTAAATSGGSVVATSAATSVISGSRTASASHTATGTGAMAASKAAAPANVVGMGAVVAGLVAGVFGM